MLRYKTETRPGLVALYDIQPGNGAGQFLQPQSPHGVIARGLSGRVPGENCYRATKVTNKSSNRECTSLKGSCTNF